ncbi:uncharacterized protein KY384_003578 [Bacidia gigantensis]|uniref:uncharacterized protein n=1 Tax=Bacidia gigantensis TaxID=2732470 RepID=UPI001D05986C|nr:uncharacterized protein KY384_003578 [Bacidia gigantensis]KAG8531942.1 hypothetical protein KY384_003578 [Bacidia gigantensis]
MSIDHVILGCSANKLEAEIAFLNAALSPLGIKEQFRVVPQVVAFGNDEDKRFFWVSGLDRNQQPIEGDKPTHIAFKAHDKDQIDAFHKAAMETGGKDNGAPGPRKHYHAGYYGAFAISPAGNNIEAVIHNFVQ